MNMHYSICHIHSPQLTFELHSRTINFFFCFCCFHSLLACSKNYMLDCIGDRVKIYIFLIDNLNTLLNMMIMMMIVHCATARWWSHLFLFIFHRQSLLANELDAFEGVCEERIMVSEEKIQNSLATTHSIELCSGCRCHSQLSRGTWSVEWKEEKCFEQQIDFSMLFAAWTQRQNRAAKQKQIWIGAVNSLHIETINLPYNRFV